jgi:hypothetical protein
MDTSNIPAAGGLNMDWVNQLNASAQSHYTQDVATWAQSLLDAARSQGYEASLTSMGAGSGVPVLNVCDKAIPLGTMRYGEFQKYGWDPARWISSQVNGTLYESTPEASALSQQEQLAALESAKDSGQTAGGPNQVQTFIDQLKALWATQAPSTQTQCGGQTAQLTVDPPVRYYAQAVSDARSAPSVEDPKEQAQNQADLPVRPVTQPPADWLNDLNAASQSGYAEHVDQWAQSLLQAAQSLGYTASLSSTGGGGVGAPVLTVGDTVIPLAAIRYGEFQKYGLDPTQWIQSQVSGTLYPLSPEARTLSQQEQLAALESAKVDAQSEAGAGQIQAFIDQMKTFWAAQAGTTPGQSA